MHMESPVVAILEFLEENGFGKTKLSVQGGKVSVFHKEGILLVVHADGTGRIVVMIEKDFPLFARAAFESLIDEKGWTMKGGKKS